MSWCTAEKEQTNDSAAGQPNFLILMVDQMAGPLLDSDMIDHLHVPNIKKLIEKGVKFDNAYTSSPLCTPSRGGFMTGQLPSKNGIYDNAAEFKSTTPSFAHYLRDLGYQTALSGKMHFVGADQLHGFEERLTTDIYPADFGWTPDWENPLERIDWWYHNLSSVTGAGVSEISNQLEFDDETAYYARLQLYKYARRIDPRPFCLCVSFTHPHDPYVTRRKYWDLYNHNTIPMPKTPCIPYNEQDTHSKRLYDAVDHTNFDIKEEDIRNARHAYFANISYLDDQIGELLDVLERCEFSENTHIILCADHGDMLGERGLWYKMSFFEYSARVPLVLTAPGVFDPGVVHTPVANHDILPTLVELAGGDGVFAAPIDGASLVSLARDKQDDSDRAAYSEYCAEGSVAPMIMIRRGVYKFVYCSADGPQLFNLEEDPNELVNLVEGLTFVPRPGKQHEFQHLLDEFYLELKENWDIEKFDAEVRLSQRSRTLVGRANRKGKFTPWDYQPKQDAINRFMRNHMDLNVLEAANRFPKPTNH